MSNLNKALALINTFTTGDAAKASELLDENYIQHNLAYGTGRNAFVESVEFLASAPVKTTVDNIRAFDVFRFNEAGKIAEHWDNLAKKAPQNPSGRTQIDGPTEIKDLDKTEANRELVKNFLFDVMQGNHPEKTPEYFEGDVYLQHNTGIADGLSGLGASLEELAKQNIQMVYDKVHQVLAQGNYALAISEGTLGNAKTAYYDLWRIENGKIKEHWDVMETIADKKDWQNQNGKF